VVDKRATLVFFHFCFFFLFWVTSGFFTFTASLRS
jgi:hypothetical protein